MTRPAAGLVLAAALACAGSTAVPDEGVEFDRPARLAGALRAPFASAGSRARPVGATAPFHPVSRSAGAEADVQVNDPSRDTIYDFPSASSPGRPRFAVNQSETSLAVFGPTVVVTYNDTAGVRYELVNGVPSVASASVVSFSTSRDGGRTWVTGPIPAPPNAETDVDNAVDVDRGGRFYAATLSDTDGKTFSVAVSHSADGLNWSVSAVPSVEASDKPWLAVGPDPLEPSRDVVYVTWTHFVRTGTFLRLARSRDGGGTWTTSTLVPPGPDSAAVQFTNPFVDRRSGRLWVAYVRSVGNSKAVEMTESDDGGASFRQTRFSFATPSPDRILFDPVGDACSCAGTTFEALHAGPNLAPASDPPLYVQSWWIGDQPSVAADGDLVALAWAGRTGARSDVFVTISRDGGVSWSTPVAVNPVSGDGVRHAEPALALDASNGSVHVAYYTQHADETYDVDLSTLRPADGYASASSMRLTTRPSEIPPSNVDDGSGTRVNFDGMWGPCYSQGHYMMIRAESGNVHVAWTDARNTMTHPVNARDPLSGVTHSQPDVFYRRVRP